DVCYKSWNLQYPYRNDRLCFGDVHSEPYVYAEGIGLQEPMERSLSDAFPGIFAYGSGSISGVQRRVFPYKKSSRRKSDRPYTCHRNCCMYLFPDLSAYL